MAIARAALLAAAWALLTGSVNICKRPPPEPRPAPGTIPAGWVCSEWQAGECVTLVRELRWRTTK